MNLLQVQQKIQFMLKYAQSAIHFTQDSRELHQLVVLLTSSIVDTESSRTNTGKERLSQEDESVNIAEIVMKRRNHQCDGLIFLGGLYGNFWDERTGCS